MGKFALKKMNAAGVSVGPARCEWFEVQQDGMPAERVCWSRAFGLPLRIDQVDQAGQVAGRSERVFEMDVVRKIAPSDAEFRNAFHIDPKGLRVMQLGADDTD